MKNKTIGKLIKGSALAIDISAPLIATICQFPIWVEKSSSATVSGVFLVFLFLSCLPFLNQIKTWLKSPSIPILWCVFLVLFTIMRNIINQMWIICFVGAVSNGVGSLVYKLGAFIEGGSDVKNNGGDSK